VPTKSPEVAPWIRQTLPRFGFFSRGVVYLIVGSVAARVALLQRGSETGPTGALGMLLSAAFGRFALLVVMAGLVSFAIYRLLQAARVKRGLRRVAPVASASVMLFLAFSSLELLLHVRRAGNGTVLKQWGRRILGHSWGPPLLVIGGAVAVIVGTVRVGRATLGKLPSDYTDAIIAREHKKWLTVLARAGLVAHGIVVATAGLSILLAGLHADSRALVDTAGALRKLRFVQGGPALFALVAVGLIAHGVSLLALAAHPRRPPR